MLLLRRAKQELICAACGARLPPDSRFCNRCGQAVAAAVPAAPEPESFPASAGEAPAPAAISAQAQPEARRETAPAEAKKRGRKPVEKLPVGNPTPGFPNVSGFYNNPYANVSPGQDAVVIGMGRWIARVDKQFHKTLF